MSKYAQRDFQLMWGPVPDRQVVKYLTLVYNWVLVQNETVDVCLAPIILGLVFDLLREIVLD